MPPHLLQLDDLRRRRLGLGLHNRRNDDYLHLRHLGMSHVAGSDDRMREHDVDDRGAQLPVRERAEQRVLRSVWLRAGWAVLEHGVD